MCLCISPYYRRVYKKEAVSLVQKVCLECVWKKDGGFDNKKCRWVRLGRYTVAVSVDKWVCGCVYGRWVCPIARGRV